MFIDKCAYLFIHKLFVKKASNYDVQQNKLILVLLYLGKLSRNLQKIVQHLVKCTMLSTTVYSLLMNCISKINIPKYFILYKVCALHMVKPTTIFTWEHASTQVYHICGKLYKNMEMSAISNHTLLTSHKPNPHIISISSEDMLVYC